MKQNTSETIVADSNCYQYISNKDTVTLKTNSADGLLTGTLDYNFYEKDKNKGTIQGKMNGEMLIADYTFSSEGMLSVRQVVFKKVANDLIEGYGEIEVKGNKAKFRNLDSVTFNNMIVLKNIGCE